MEAVGATLLLLVMLVYVFAIFFRSQLGDNKHFRDGTCADGLAEGPLVDLVVSNPPFVPPERQDKALRLRLSRQFDWLKGRFDMAIPMAAVAVSRCRKGGGVGLILPAPSLVQPYGAPLRRQWLARHRITSLEGPTPFPGASVGVFRVALAIGAGPAALPSEMEAGEVLRLDNVPLDPSLRRGDVDIVEGIRSRSVPLGSLCLVDTGVVAHGPKGGRDRLVFEDEAPGLVRYADARDFFSGKHRWMAYKPAEMHRAKRPSMFERPKIVVQRLRGAGPVRAQIDRSGIYLGHTCTIVQPNDPAWPLEPLLTLILSPWADAMTRIERGSRLDLYPRDVAAFPVPRAWMTDPEIPLDEALGLAPTEKVRLMALSRS